MGEDDDSAVVVFTSGNYMEAHFVASVLNGSEIEAFVIDDNVCRIYPWVALLIGGAKVLVKANDAERSREVVAAVEADESPITGNFLSIPLSEPAALIVLFRKWVKGHRELTDHQ